MKGCFAAATAAVFTAALMTAAGASRATSDEREVRGALDRMADAGLRRDVAAMRSVYADRYFHTSPDGSVMDRAAVLASYEAPSPFAFSASRRSEERIALFGGCAVVNAIVTLEGTRSGQPFTSRYRITYVLVRAGRRWQIANSHVTLLGIDPKPGERPSA